MAGYDRIPHAHEVPGLIHPMPWFQDWLDTVFNPDQETTDERA